MKFSSLLTVSLTVSGLLLSACSKQTDEPAPSPGGVVTPETTQSYDPEKRWPETGNYQFEFSESKPGLVCSTGSFVFTKKSEYCLALQNRELVKGCGLESRKDLYLKDCGSDFSESNLSAIVYAGFDPSSGISCETKPLEKADNLDVLCDHLQNESLHSYCHWDARKIEFQVLGCQGVFSVRPEQSETNTPDPIVDVPGDGSAAPNEEALESSKKIKLSQIQSSLGQSGINFNESAGLRCRTALSPERRLIYLQKVVEYLDIVAGKVDQLQSSRESLTEVSIGCSDLFDPESKKLVLDPFKDADHFDMVMISIKRVVSFQKKSGIKLDVSINPNVVEAYVGQLEQRISALQDLNSLVTKISFASSSGMYLRDGQLYLQLDNILPELDRLYAGLKDLASFARLTKSLGLQLRTDLSQVQNSSLRDLRALAQTLNSERTALQKFIGKGWIKNLSIQETGSGIEVSLGDGLSIALGPDSDTQVYGFLRSLEKADKLEKILGVRILLRPGNYSEDFPKFLDLLESNQADLIAKQALIKNVSMAFRSFYDKTNKSLALSSKDSRESISRLIKSIR